jgi:DNA-binding transcriptional regulator YhcF (GntR family)
MTTNSAHAVRDLLLDRLTQGVYPLGSKLPTAQALASELGLHRNTVAKAYHMLAHLGLVSIQQGRGTFVVAQPESTNRRSLATQIPANLTAVIRQARQVGLAEQDMWEAVEQAIAAVYRPPHPQAAYVECNTGDIEAGIAEIEAMTGARLEPLHLQQVAADPAGAVANFNTVFTSLIHIKEVSELLEPVRPDLQIVGVYTQPDEAAMAQIAHIPEGSHVGIVVTIAEGARRFENQINTVTQVTTQAAVMPSDEDVVRLAAAVNAIVCSRSWAERLRSFDLPVPIIELGFHISQQSALRVMELLHAGPIGNGQSGMR